MPIESPKTFTVVDPRLADGDVFDVAARACSQATAIARILTGCITTANIMARNAEMERELQRGEDPNAPAWPDSPQGRLFEDLIDATRETEKRLEKLTQAASYNPRRPLKA